MTEEAANHGKLDSAGSPGQCLASGTPRSESAGGLRAGSWGRVGSCQFESLNWLGCVVCVSSSAQAARTPPHFTKTTHTHTHTHTLYFTNDNKNSPGFEHLLEKAGRASFAVHGKIKKMGNIVPELMVRLGNIMIKPIVLFAW